MDAIEKSLQSLVKSRPYQEGRIVKIAAIRDADVNPTDATGMMHRAFQSVGWPQPAPGTFEGGQNIEVGLFVVPSSDQSGDLERLCLATVADVAKAQSVTQFYAQMDATYGPLDRPYKRQCAIYLACTNVETRGPGQAFSIGVFDRQHGVLEPLKQFLTLFLG
ncbi:DUF3226 domain-containing protein [Rhizobium jaguaris]|uniref:DUF3226 domain-containing protein n=1 Tax=Rhizobium jaguaris TaxID=1312183 RepID=UPI00315DA680